MVYCESFFKLRLMRLAYAASARLLLKQPIILGNVNSVEAAQVNGFPLFRGKPLPIVYLFAFYTVFAG